MEREFALMLDPLQREYATVTVLAAWVCNQASIGAMSMGASGVESVRRTGVLCRDRLDEGINREGVDMVVEALKRKGRFPSVWPT